MNGQEQGFAVEAAYSLPPGHFADAVTSDGRPVGGTAAYQDVGWGRPSS